MHYVVFRHHKLNVLFFLDFTQNRQICLMDIIVVNVDKERLLVASSDKELITCERGSEDKPIRISLTQQLNQDYESTVLLQNSNNRLVLSISLVPLHSFDTVIGERLIVLLDGEETEITTTEYGDAEFICPVNFAELSIVWPAQNSLLLLTCQNINYTDDTFVTVSIMQSADKVARLVVHGMGLQVAFDGTLDGFTNAWSRLLEEEVHDERGRTCTARELLKRLKKKGVNVVPNSGRHPYKAMLTDGRTVPIPFHNGDIPSGTFRAILGQLGMSYDDLMSNN